MPMWKNVRNRANGECAQMRKPVVVLFVALAITVSGCSSSQSPSDGSAATTDSAASTTGGLTDWTKAVCNPNPSAYFPGSAKELMMRRADQADICAGRSGKGAVAIGHYTSTDAAEQDLNCNFFSNYSETSDGSGAFTGSQPPREGTLVGQSYSR